MNRIYIVLCFLLISSGLWAQNTFSGKIFDENREPLAGVNVYLPEINKGTISDIEGYYQINNLPGGRIKVQFSFLGYKNRIVVLDLNKEDLVFDVQLMPTQLEFEELVISGGYIASQHENAVKVDILNLNSQVQKNTPNFAELLTKVPGVDMISKGSGISKPVIRGLSMSNILVLNNGVRLENYQYSDHHPLGIDEYGVETVEIIKGPASLLYGSDAIGGVLNFIKEKPASVGYLKGDYNLGLFSNTLGVNQNLGLNASSRNLFGGFRVGQKSHSDFLQGGGEFAPNTRFNEVSAKANLGHSGKLGSFKVFYDYNSQSLGFAEDEAIEEITERGRKREMFYQDLNTHLLSFQNNLYLGAFRLDLNLAYQNTLLAHIEEDDEVELEMNLRTLTYETKLYLPSGEKTDYIIGLQGFNQRNINRNDREVILLPDATTDNYSAFGLFQYSPLKRLKIQTGLRYDNKLISTAQVGNPNSETFRESIRNTYDNFSGSLGMTLGFTDEIYLRGNFASAFRTPNLAELTSNGPHELRYEIGDKSLDPENAYEGDLSLHYHKESFTFDVAGFYNLINDYIYISPTGEKTAENLSIYRYQQADSRLYGGEIGLHIHPENYKWLHLESTFSKVTGKQKTGEYLPFIPANKLRFEFSVERDKLSFIERPNIALITSYAFAQNHPAPEETTTPGYTLIDLSLTGSLKIGNQTLNLGIHAKNLLDARYIDHLSTLKEVNLLNPGRNISLNLKIPFNYKFTD